MTSDSSDCQVDQSAIAFTVVFDYGIVLKAKYQNGLWDYGR